MMLVLCSMELIVFCGAGILRIDFHAWNKDDVREATEAWYKCGAYESKTLVHQWDDAIFYFYLMHDKAYHESYISGIETAELWIRSADEKEMGEQLEELGYLNLSDFYYVAPISGSYGAFLEVVKSYGYTVNVIYEGNSALLYVVK